MDREDNMKTMLHIISTPRGSESRTLKVSQAFIDNLKSDWKVDDLNLFKEKLPELTTKRIDGKYTLLSGKDLSEETKEAWEEIITCIKRFLSAGAYLVSTPMWNFGIPYRLKHYIDIILQPNYLFRYTASGPEGLVKNKKMVVITSRGGDYSADDFRKYDLQEPYIRTVFGFAGITDISFINAQPMDALGPDVQDEKIKEAVIEAKKIAGLF